MISNTMFVGSSPVSRGVKSKMVPCVIVMTGCILSEHVQEISREVFV